MSDSGISNKDMGIERITDLRDKIVRGDEITEEDREFFMGICEIEYPHDITRAVRYLNDVIREQKAKLASLEEK